MTTTHIEENLECCQEALQFQKFLNDTVNIRFGTNYSTRGVVDAAGKTRKIVTVNVFKSKVYILAALLDPRVKLVPFQGKRIK